MVFNEQHPDLLSQLSKTPLTYNAGRLQCAVPIRSKKSIIPLLQLTARQQKILSLWSTGISMRHIAEKLFISPRTVESHIISIKNSTGLNKKQELIQFCLNMGWQYQGLADSQPPY